MVKGRDEQEFNVKLVEAVEKHPCLYNNVLPEYSRKNVTENAWAEVAKKVHEQVTTCKEKWKNIRTVFVRKLKKSEQSGKWEKPYYLNDRMQFLLPFLKSNTLNLDAHGNPPSPPSETKYSESEDDADDSNVEIKLEQTDVEDAERETTTQNAIVRQGRKRKFEFDEEDDSFTEFSNQQNCRQNDNDPRYMFLMSLLPEIHDMTEYQMRRFKRRVLTLIDDILEDPVSAMPSTSISTPTDTSIRTSAKQI